MKDYQKRFVDEYHALKDKYTKLHKMVIKYEAGTLEFEPNCPLDLLKQQKAAMGQYLYCLELRAEIGKITL